MSIVATLEEIANDVGFKDKRAFVMLKGIRDKSPQEQAAIAQSLIDDGLLLSGSVGALQYEIDAITEAESDTEEVGAASELPVAETTAKDLENAKETTTPTEDKPKTFGDQIAESKTLRAFFPRTYERLDRGETGVIGAGLAGALDLPSSIGRGGVAFGKLISGNLDAEKGESFLGEMSKIEKSPNTTGVGGFTEAVARDPLTALSFGGVGLGRAVGAKLIPEAVSFGKKVGQAATAGSVAAAVPATGVSLAQLALGEKDLGGAAMQTGLSAVGGGVGGALGQTIGGLLKRKAAPIDENGIVRPELAAGKDVYSADELDEEAVKAIARELEIPESQAAAIPRYAQGVAVNLSQEERNLFKDFIRQAFVESRAPTSTQKLTPTAIVSQGWETGLKAMDQERKNLGSQMGQIESQAFENTQIPLRPILNRFNNALSQKMGFGIFQNSDGTYYAGELGTGSKVDESLTKGVDDILKTLSKHGESVNGEQLRNIERTIRSKLNELSSTRYDQGKTPFDAVADDLYRAVGEEVRGTIAQKLGQEAADRYRNLRKGYAESLTDMDYLQRRMGQLSENEAEVFGQIARAGGSARGTMMVKSLVNARNSDSRARDLSQKIKKLTGIDLYKQGALATWAEELAGSMKAGVKSEPFRPKEKVIETIGSMFGMGSKNLASKAATAAARGVGGSDKALRIARGRGHAPKAARKGATIGQAAGITAGITAGMATQDPNARMRGTSLTPAEIIQRDLERRNALLNSKKK